jgi:hypothetical protein
MYQNHQDTIRDSDLYESISMPYPTPFAAKTTHEKKHPRQRITNGGSNALTWGFSLLMSRRRRWSLHHGTFGAQFWQEGEVGLALGILVLV